MTSRPRREWKSFLWVDRWLVRLRIRSLKIATWTSGDPVSASFAPYSVMSACLRSPVIDIDPVPSAIDDSYRAKAPIFDPGQRNQSQVVPSADDRAFFEPVETSQRARIARRNPLPAAQPGRFGSRQDQSRDVVQPSLDRKQKSAIHCYMPTLGDRIQCNRLAFREAPNRKAAQFGDVSKRYERYAEIARQRTDIGPLADQRLALRMVAIGDRHEPQLGNLHRPRGRDRRFIAPGEFVGSAPIDLDRRIGWRPLLDRTDKGGEDRLDRLTARPCRVFADDLALAVIGRARNAPADAKAIPLAAGHCVSRRLGRFAKGDRQHAGRQRVERAGVSDLCPGAAANHLDDPVRGEAERLVDDEPAVETAVNPHRLGPRPWRLAAGDRAPPRAVPTRRRSGRPDQTSRRARKRGSARCAIALPARRVL